MGNIEEQIAEVFHQCLQALDINIYDAWASHCVAHIREMTGQFKDGIQFMSNTENNWNVSTMFEA